MTSLRSKRYEVPYLHGIYELTEDGRLITIRENFKLREKDPTYKFYHDAVHSVDPTGYPMGNVDEWFRRLNTCFRESQRGCTIMRAIDVTLGSSYGYISTTLVLMFEKTPCLNNLVEIRAGLHNYPNPILSKYLESQSGLKKDILEGKVHENYNVRYDGECYIESRKGKALLDGISNYVSEKILEGWVV
jgi:hypothetical protein